MSGSPRFAPDWEPTLLEEEVVGEGRWLYQDAIGYSARLVRRRWDYTSADLQEIESKVDEIAMDHVDYDVSDDGDVFFWIFEGASGQSVSPTFPSLELAKSHIHSYAGTATVKWSKL